MIKYDLIFELYRFVFLEKSLSKVEKSILKQSLEESAKRSDSPAKTLVSTVINVTLSLMFTLKMQILQQVYMKTKMKQTWEPVIRASCSVMPQMSGTRKLFIHILTFLLIGSLKKWLFKGKTVKFHG